MKSIGLDKLDSGAPVSIYSREANGMLTIVQKLDGAYSSQVLLIEIEGKKWVYKKSDPNEIGAEKYYQRTLGENGLPALTIYNEIDLRDDEMIIQYVEGSTTLFTVSDRKYFRQFGATLAKIHRITHNGPMRMATDGLYEISQQTFIEEIIAQGIDRVEKKKSGLSPKMIDEITRICLPLTRDHSHEIGLLHGDLHQNNVLLEEDTVYPYDVADTITYGDPYWDLAHITIGFPYGRYVHAKKDQRDYDITALSAISEGYGFDFTKTNEELLDRYVLLKCFYGYPNPFEEYLIQIIDRLVQKYR